MLRRVYAKRPDCQSESMLAWCRRLAAKKFDGYKHRLGGNVAYVSIIRDLLLRNRSSELRAIREVNEGAFGKHIYFEEYPLHIETGEMRHYRQVWRFINMETADQQGRERPFYKPGQRMQTGRTDQISPL